MIKQKKRKKIASVGIVNVKISFNNAIITICDEKGNVICWSSTGMAGFKGARKSTPYAGQSAAKIAAEKAVALGLEKSHVVIKGSGKARESVLDAFMNAGLTILSITDATPLPHNGCRPPKKRRL